MAVDVYKFLHSPRLVERSGLVEFSTKRNRLLVVSNFGQVRSISYRKEYLDINNGTYMCTNGLRVVISTWLNIFQISYDVVRLNSCARE